MGNLPSGEQFEIRHGDIRAVAVEVGGGIREFVVGNMHVLDGYAVDEMCSAGRGQLLLPWPNRIRDGTYSFQGELLRLPLSEPAKGNAIHGLTRWVNWSPGGKTEKSVTLEYRLRPQPGYPFAVDLSAEYDLSDSGLTVTMRGTNVGPRACPFGAGAHPYLRCGSQSIDQDFLEIPAEEFLVVDQQQIPTGRQRVAGTANDFREPRAIGETVLDTGYADLRRDEAGRACVALRGPGSGVTVTLWMDRQFPYVMVFTGDTVRPETRRRQGLAVEPMTAAPNGFNSAEGLTVLNPGESFEGSWGISLDG